VCEGKVLPYRLTVAIDEMPVVNELVRASGARQDRPLYVYREIPLVAGSHRIQAEFVRQGTLGAETRAEERAEDHAEHGDIAAAPERLALDTTLALREREITLLTYDVDTESLVVRTK
jgi:hypothetical protein